MSIILIGYRGSGKTTVGRLLAQQLGRPFLDSDDQIVAAAGKSIKDIFQQDGEESFRDTESQVINQLAGLPDHVLSLGGEALLRPSNRAALSAGKHTVIYLKADPAILHQRIHNDAATAASRPALTHLGGGIEEIRTLLAVREPIYRQMMTAELDVGPLSAHQAVAAILKLL